MTDGPSPPATGANRGGLLVLSRHRAARLQRHTRIGTAWPMALLALGGYLALGCFPFYAALIVLEAGAQPSWADGIVVPWGAWVYTTFLLLGSLTGMLCGYWMFDCTAEQLQTRLWALLFPAGVSAAVIVALVAAVVVWPDTEYAKDNQWSIGVVAVYSVYSFAVKGAWGVLCFQGFRLRTLFLTEAEEVLSDGPAELSETG